MHHSGDTTTTTMNNANPNLNYNPNPNCNATTPQQISKMVCSSKASSRSSSGWNEHISPPSRMVGLSPSRMVGCYLALERESANQQSKNDISNTWSVGECWKTCEHSSHKAESRGERWRFNEPSKWIHKNILPTEQTSWLLHVRPSTERKGKKTNTNGAVPTPRQKKMRQKKGREENTKEQHQGFQRGPPP